MPSEIIQAKKKNTYSMLPFMWDSGNTNQSVVTESTSVVAWGQG